MANVYRNIFIRELAEVLHDPFMNHRTRSGYTVLIDRLVQDEKRRYPATRKKRTFQGAWRAAASYADLAQTDEVYVNKARGRDVTAYSIAFADWFSRPRVLQIDVDAWTGEVGETIRVKARDNVRVTGVLVVIRDVEGNLIELGEAVQSAAGGAWWSYTTRARIPMIPFPSVQAVAQNLAGNRDSFTI